MRNFRFKPFIKGTLTRFPALQSLIHSQGTGGTCQAEYCYEVWMKHLVMLWRQGLNDVPKVVAELGPGDSLGMGFAALFSGAEQFIALDVERYGNSNESNLKMFDELLKLFQQRAGRWKAGWPNYDADLDSRLFPSHILTEERLKRSLDPERIAHLREAVRVMGTPEAAADAPVKYFAPWDNEAVVQPGTVDLIYSQSVLEHVNDPQATYRAFRKWLKPGGWISHQADFSCHELANYWNGHWAYSEPLWKLILGKRGFLLNRKPYSTHVKLAREEGFNIKTELRNVRNDGLPRESLAEVARGFTEEDATTASLFFQAVRA